MGVNGGEIKARGQSEGPCTTTTTLLIDPTSGHGHELLSMALGGLVGARLALLWDRIDGLVVQGISRISLQSESQMQRW